MISMGFFLLLAVGIFASGCSSLRTQSHHRWELKRASVFVRLSRNESAKQIRNRFARIAAHGAARSGQFCVIGVYRSFPSGWKLPHVRTNCDASLIFQGKRIWGGVFARFDHEGQCLIWLHEPRHRDRLISRRFGILEAGRWELDRGARLMLFCHFRNGRHPGPGWRAWLERYIAPLQKGFSRIQILVFNDRLECRQFASGENRRSRLLTAAISPGPREALLLPVDTHAGYWAYRSQKKTCAWVGGWKQIPPSTHR
ncbi:MAG: hypothetical protein JXA62_00145 [Candidatus Aminicenantes bacterium]|nr:hypothetical protein [Candidatus Aminicenantes bacterium]